MPYTSTFTLDVLKNLRSKIHSDSFKDSYRTDAKYFTRNRVLTFANLITSSLNMMSKSLSVEADKLVNILDAEGGKSLSKQAYSKARTHLKFGAFVELNELFVTDYYAKCPSLNLYQDKYLMLACDGSTIELVHTAELKEKFGTADSQEEGMVTARISKLYDVLNGINIVASIESYKTDERSMLKQHLTDLQALAVYRQHPIILVLDRGYPSFALLYLLDSLKIKYIIRCASNFCTEVSTFSASTSLDSPLFIDLTLNDNRKAIAKKCGQDSISTRCVKVQLNTQQTEYLLTNLTPEELPTSAFKEAYFLRWGCETDYDHLKNVVEMENFSSQLENGIKQEFYAKILTLNTTKLFIKDAQELVDQEAKKKQ